MPVGILPDTAIPASEPRRWQAPACYELSSFVAEELPALLEAPPQRPPPILVSAKALADRRRGRLINDAHHAAARSAGKKMAMLEEEASAAGLTVVAYMRATGQYPMEDPDDAQSETTL